MVFPSYVSFFPYCKRVFFIKTYSTVQKAPCGVFLGGEYALRFTQGVFLYPRAIFLYHYIYPYYTREGGNFARG